HGGDHAEKRRLACAVGAQKAGHAGAEVEGDAVDGAGGSERLVHFGDLDGGPRGCLCVGHALTSDSTVSCRVRATATATAAMAAQTSCPEGRKTASLTTMLRRGRASPVWVRRKPAMVRAIHAAPTPAAAVLTG